LSSCPSKNYILLSQENVNLDDFTSDRAVPFLRRALKSDGVKSVINVAEVVGQSSADVIQQYLQETCGATIEVHDGMESPEKSQSKHVGKDSATIARVNFKGLPSTEPKRSAQLADHDAYLNTVLEELPVDSAYTVIYTTTPVSAETHITYEPTFQDQEPLHVELKRQIDFVPRADEKNATSPPLFEKYQFLSPGIFMGLLTIIILLSILSVGISAIAGLQVSYGAFDKEMGPASGKKQ